MTYELALALKNAGYIQPEDHEGEGWVLVGNQKLGETENVYAPTLEELLEACGDDFRILSTTLLPQRQWHCEGTNSDSKYMFGRFHGSTPTEAVALLWLALNK